MCILVSNPIHFQSLLDPSHNVNHVLDDLLQNELGWEPEYTFDTGIKKTIEWYLNNKDWWEHIINGEYQAYYEKMYGNR